MRFGRFDDARMEYVVERPDTPKSWSNYLGSTEYGSIITNNAGGYSFYKSAAQGRMTRFRTNCVPMDQPGKYIYIRDDRSGDYWSSSWQPVGKDLKDFKSVCRHGTGYTVISSEYDSILSETTYFVPLGQDFEVWRVKVTNKGRKSRSLSLFSFVEFTMNWTLSQDVFNVQYTGYIVKMDMAGDIIRFSHNDNLKENPDDFQDNDQCRHVFFGSCGGKVKGFDTDRDVFLGPYRSYSNPLVVEKGSCAGSLAHGDNGCATLHIPVALKPGESRELAFFMGVGRAETEGRRVVRSFGNFKRLDKEFGKLVSHWHERIGNFRVKTPDADFNSMINVWNAYNCLLTFAWSRAASLIYNGGRDGLGYRDTVQDFLGVMVSSPDMVAERLELMISGQCSTGGAMRVVKPFAHKPGSEKATEEDQYRSDDCLWLFNSIPEFVKETGDLSFYDKVIPYADKGRASVLGHLRRAIEFNLERSGIHGLPCGLDADWNDCIRLGEGGESVFVAFQLRYALNTYIEISKMLGRAKEAAWAGGHLERLDASIRRHCWDGEWFVRAFRHDGWVIGSKKDPEGSIFLNPQSWAVISGAGTDAQRKKAMESVKRRLTSKYGIHLCYPPFRKTDYHVMRAVLFNATQKENGGIFSQTQPWAVMAETLLGNGDRAYEYYRAYMPSAYNDRAEIREIEPYVHCQSTHGRQSRRFGASRLPWLTGTAAWSYHAATNYIIGVRPDYEGLKIEPCLPKKWNKVEVWRKFRDSLFHIVIKNGRKGKGVKALKLNGKPVKGNFIPLSSAAGKNKVEVELL